VSKGRPFLEVFASAASEDYRFPVLEIFAFLFVLGQFVLANLNIPSSINSGELMIYWLVSSGTGIQLLLFLILMLKNVSYGFGRDFEKGTFQTELSYPLSRRKILVARLLSGIGIAVLLLLGVQIVALFIEAPAMILPNIGLILLLFVSNFGELLLLTSIILLLALLIKRGNGSLIIGIAACLAVGVGTSILMLLASMKGSVMFVQIGALLNPSLALSAYFGYASGGIVWSPSLVEAAFYVLGNYVITAILFSVAYYYFARRLSF